MAILLSFKDNNVDSKGFPYANISMVKTSIEGKSKQSHFMGRSSCTFQKKNVI